MARRHTCYVVLCKSIWGCVAGGMWSATFSLVRRRRQEQPSLAWHASLRITAFPGVNTNLPPAVGFWGTPLALWELHRFFSSIYFHVFVTGSRRRPPKSTQPQNIRLRPHLLLLRWQKPVAKLLRY